MYTYLPCYYHCSIFYASGSYLEVPRISFNGHVRIDVNTRNNVNCNFDTNIPVDPNPNEDWNSNGTSEFSFFNCTVKTALNTSGDYVGSGDPVVGAKVLTNINQSFPKLVDIDVDYQLIKSGVYGMNLLLEVNNKVALQATLESNVLAQDVWTRSLCTNDTRTTYLSSKTVSILSNVQWGNGSKESATLSELKEISNGGNLSISMVIYFYTRNMPSFLYTNFTLGYVMGTIGVARPTEPLNFAGSRLLSYKDAYPVNIPITDKTDSCYNDSLNNKTPVWMYKAPFKIYQTSNNNNALAVDFSNALAFDVNGNMRDLGKLQVAVVNVKQMCTQLIGSPLPYLEQEWNAKGGIVDYTVDDITAKLLESSPLIVVRIGQGNYPPPPCEGIASCFLTFVNQTLHTITSRLLALLHHLLHTITSFLSVFALEFEQQMTVAPAGINYLPPPCNGIGDVPLQLMLNETQYYVRTMDYYVGRLEYNQTMDIRILVTQYGKPVPNIQVNVMQSNNVLPPQGVQVLQNSGASYTDENGLATFTFQANKIPFPRQYSNDPSQTTTLPKCENVTTLTLPIDGQVYMFNYSVMGTAVNSFTYQYDVFTDVNEIAILGYSYSTPYQPYTWKKDIEPIFSQYDHLYGKVMRPIVQLSNFRSVTIPRNLNLIQLAMSLDVNHPSYMPVTRELSPTKRNVILEWLKNPIFDDNNQTEKAPFEVPICSPPKTFAATSLAESYFYPPNCRSLTSEQGHTIQFNLDFSNPSKDDNYFNDIFQQPTSPSDIRSRSSDTCTECNLTMLQDKLQLAMQLEFATIPPYLTALYSIIEGCNLEIQQLIRSIVMQEMLHLLQVTNILIAIGGEPKIDDSSVVPHYPTIGLPGGVLPRLRVSLNKLTLMHIYEVFMGIEVPHDTHVDHPGIINNNTIGQFYKQIDKCIHCLGDEIFTGNIARQVMWPWPTNVGTVYSITNVSSASKAIREIVEQGEGVSPFDPKQGDLKRLAHFYKFEEIVCQKKLIKTKDGYAYVGDSIPYNPQGVWPMKANPSSADIPPNNNCYTEAKAFHGAYRSLLRNLQEIFSGKVDGTTGMKNAVTIMESMAVHARKLMWTKIRPEDDQTCGPVWDFDWVESKCT